jgi:hypothetical protein
MVSRGRGPLRALLAPLPTSLDAILGALHGDFIWHLLATAWGHHPTSLGLAKHDHLMACGAVGGDVTRLLYRVPEKFNVPAPEQNSWAALKQRTRTQLASLAVGLGLTAPAPPPQWAMRQETSKG